jgi:hypothetical protein
MHQIAACMPKTAEMSPPFAALSAALIMASGKMQKNGTKMSRKSSHDVKRYRTRKT